MDEWQTWIFIAENDLESAILLSNNHKPLIENACYHSQQCAEKSFKAFLIFSNVEFPFTHNLSVLCKKCEEVEPNFSKLRRQAIQLTPFATRTRYEMCLDLTVEDCKLAIKRAEEVMVLVKNIISSMETPS